MNRFMSATLALLLVVAAVVAVNYGTKYRDEVRRYAATRESEDAVKKQFDSALSSIAEIQDSLNAIAPQEARLAQLSQQAENGTLVSRSQKQQMLATISDLRESIHASHERIQTLEGKLKGSENRVASLDRVIAGLKKSVADKERVVELLTARVDSLSTTVIGLRGDVARGEETIAEQEQTIQDKQKELGAVYYVIGTRRELKDRGIVARTGGFLGLGRSTQVASTFRESDFTPLDTDQQPELDIPGTQPRVLSAQSAASYEIRGEKDPRTLVIKDAGEFRKVKYLVIMIGSHLPAATTAAAGSADVAQGPTASSPR